MKRDARITLIALIPVVVISAWLIASMTRPHRGTTDSFGMTVSYRDSAGQIPKEAEGTYELRRKHSEAWIIQAERLGTMIFNYNFAVTKGRESLSLRKHGGRRIFEIDVPKRKEGLKKVRLTKGEYDLVLTCDPGIGRFHIAWESQ